MASSEVPYESPLSTVENSHVAGRPQEHFDVQDNDNVNGATPTGTSPEEIVYPTGFALWMSITSLLLTATFYGLDMTIVAVAIPSLTNQFKTVNDIGWYSSVFMLLSSSFTFFWSKLYTLFQVKRVFLAAIFFFQLGSLLCTVAPASAVFILGRAIAGFGGSGISMGAGTIMIYSFPLQKRPFWGGLIAFVQTLAMVTAPLLGGVLIDRFTWRACFGINLPIGLLTFGLTARYFNNNPAANADNALPLKQKLKKMDLVGTFFFVPGIVCLLIALQWGGIRYGWQNARIISLLAIFAILISIFCYIQYREKEHAALPPRILKQRSVLAGAWFSVCCSGVLAITEYYIAIYFQGVKGFSATKSGALGLPTIIGLSVSALTAGALMTAVGYYYPFMIVTSVTAPVAAGLLTTLDLDESLVKVLGLLGFLGVSMGLGIQAPFVAIYTVLDPKDVPIGMALNGFAGGIGSGLFLSASSALFQNRLVQEVSSHAPSTNMTIFEQGGLADIRKQIGTDRLRDVLLGYDKAVMQTLYMPMALAILTLLGSLTMERRSVKKKQS